MDGFAAGISRNSLVAHNVCMQATRIPEGELKRVLQSMACVKVGLAFGPAACRSQTACHRSVLRSRACGPCCPALQAKL